MSGSKLDTERCRICRKNKPKIMLDAYGICFYCKQMGAKPPSATTEQIIRRRNASQLIKLLSEEIFTDDEIDLIVKDALEIRKYRKRVVEK